MPHIDFMYKIKMTRFARSKNWREIQKFKTVLFENEQVRNSIRKQQMIVLINKKSQNNLERGLVAGADFSFYVTLRRPFLPKFARSI